MRTKKPLPTDRKRLSVRIIVNTKDPLEQRFHDFWQSQGPGLARQERLRRILLTGFNNLYPLNDKEGSTQ